MFLDYGGKTLKLSPLEPSSDDIMVDMKARQVYVRGERLGPHLTRREFDMLMLLHSRRGEAVSRDDIAGYVWPEQTDGDVGNLEVEQSSHHLRVRIEEDSSNAVYVVTIRGFGYKLN